MMTFQAPPAVPVPDPQAVRSRIVSCWMLDGRDGTRSVALTVEADGEHLRLEPILVSIVGIKPNAETVANRLLLTKVCGYEPA
jgi:hypothetical protein